MKRILIVDDERKIAETISYQLQQEGFKTSLALDGEEALKLALKENPDLIVLDLMLPKISGEEICKTLRGKSRVPIIMLTAKDSEIDKVVGLEIGADDYLTKPFSLRELTARIRAVLRRTTFQKNEKRTHQIEVGPFNLDSSQHLITKDKKELKLPLKEYQIMAEFLSKPNQILARKYLLQVVWGKDFFGDSKTLDVHIRRIRKKIEKDPSRPQYIRTVRGVGFKFQSLEHKSN